MFTSNSSSSSEDGETPRTPFNAISAAATAQRQRLSRKSRICRARADPEDAEAFAYDEALESAERERRAAPRPERKSRYIGKLVKQVEKRKDEQQHVQERRMVKEREQEDHLFKDKEQFVTKAYKRQLGEREDKDKEEKEEEEQLKSRRADVSGFILGLRDRRSKGGEQNDSLEGKSPEDGGEAAVVNAGCSAGTKTQGSEAVAENAKEICETGAFEDGKKRRRSRFADVTNDAQNVNVEEGDNADMKAFKPKPERGLRRNDEQAIEVYRQRYFQRRAKRLAENAKKGAGSAG